MAKPKPAELSGLPPPDYFEAAKIVEPVKLRHPLTRKGPDLTFYRNLVYSPNLPKSKKQELDPTVSSMR